MCSHIESRKHGMCRCHVVQAFADPNDAHSFPTTSRFASLATLDDATELFHWLKVHIHTPFVLACFSSSHPRMVKRDALPAQSFHPSTISKVLRTVFPDLQLPSPALSL